MIIRTHGLQGDSIAVADRVRLGSPRLGLDPVEVRRVERREQGGPEASPARPLRTRSTRRAREQRCPRPCWLGQLARLTRPRRCCFGLRAAAAREPRRWVWGVFGMAAVVGSYRRPLAGRAAGGARRGLRRPSRGSRRGTHPHNDDEAFARGCGCARAPAPSSKTSLMRSRPTSTGPAQPRIAREDSVGAGATWSRGRR